MEMMSICSGVKNCAIEGDQRSRRWQFVKTHLVLEEVTSILLNAPRSVESADLGQSLDDTILGIFGLGELDERLAELTAGHPRVS